MTTTKINNPSVARKLRTQIKFVALILAQKKLAFDPYAELVLKVSRDTLTNYLKEINDCLGLEVISHDDEKNGRGIFRTFVVNEGCMPSLLNHARDLKEKLKGYEGGLIPTDNNHLLIDIFDGAKLKISGGGFDKTLGYSGGGLTHRANMNNVMNAIEFGDPRKYSA